MAKQKRSALANPKDPAMPNSGTGRDLQKEGRETATSYSVPLVELPATLVVLNPPEPIKQRRKPKKPRGES
jgi:hypothetical protein